MSRFSFDGNGLRLAGSSFADVRYVRRIQRHSDELACKSLAREQLPSSNLATIFGREIGDFSVDPEFKMHIGGSGRCPRSGRMASTFGAATPSRGGALNIRRGGRLPVGEKS